MKILLVNPNSRFLINEKVFPTLGLLYLSAYIKQHGYRDVTLIDMNDEEPLPARIDADIVGFYSNTPQFPTAMRLAREIRKRNLARKPLYVIGGPHVSGKPEDAAGEFDVVVAGEGERAFLDVVRAHEAGRVPDPVVRLPYIENISELPFPDRDLIDIRSYRYYLDGRLTTTVLTSRGCPFGCNFCANNAWGKSLRLRTPENVYQELKLLKERYGYGAFMFFDDTMTVNRKRMEGICSLLKELDIIYRCFIRSDTVDRGILEAMKGSGCVEVGVGIESGSPRILKIVNKGETVERNMEAVKLCRAAGLRVKGFFIVGLPGENEESLRETIAFLEEADLDDLDVTVYTPYPGSAIYRDKKRFDIEFQDDYAHAWFKGRPGNYTTKVSTKALSSADILRYRDLIEKKFKKPQPVKLGVA